MQSRLHWLAVEESASALPAGHQEMETGVQEEEVGEGVGERLVGLGEGGGGVAGVEGWEGGRGPTGHGVVGAG